MPHDGGGIAARTAPAAHLQSHHVNLKFFLARNLRLQFLEQRTGELLDPPALKTGQMDALIGQA